MAAPGEATQAAVQSAVWLTHDAICGLHIPLSAQYDAVVAEYSPGSSSGSGTSEAVIFPKKTVVRHGSVRATCMPIVDGATFQVKLGWRHYGVAERRAASGAPAVNTCIFVMDDGILSAVLDASWITTMRTGALAALAAHMLAVEGFTRVALVGLGNCLAATLDMLCHLVGGERVLDVRIVDYRNAAQFIAAFGARHANLRFSVHASLDACGDVDIVFSGVTYAAEPLMTRMPPGCVVVPIHVRGFEHFDATATHVVVDDVAGVSHFDNFDVFKARMRTTRDVVGGRRRVSADETFLVYQYGTALSDAPLTRLVLAAARAAGVGVPLEAPGPARHDWLLRQLS